MKHLCHKLQVYGKEQHSQGTIYINGKEVDASVKQIRSEMNKLVNEQNRMVIGSDEYVAHAKKIKELRQYHYKKMYFCEVIAIREIV